ncbi:MAG: 16S rRNA (guanine(966)-N(2))-methyltransferase RsmD, partial [Pseudomonadota bacterium]|nr:16S rRNA (guanine(966)-N(2))-methyltransferase RsmD [Pseudomonadota bacterium]
RPLRAPKTRITRPTSDRARESLFNVLAHAPWAPALAGARVMDVFAGSGGLGFEAISRGAAFAYFAETARPAQLAISENAKALNLSDQIYLHRRSAMDLGARPEAVEAFDLAFLDPPYQKGLVRHALNSLLSGNWMRPDALYVVEVARDEPVDITGFRAVSEKRIGAAKVLFLLRDQGPDL